MFINLVLRYILFITWITAAIAKTLHFGETVRAVEGFTGRNGKVAQLIALFTVICEMVTGIGLLLQHTFFASIVCSILLLCVFIGMIVYTLLHGKKVKCNCFGSISSHPITWMSVFRNCVLLIIAIATLITFYPMNAYPWNSPLQALAFAISLTLITLTFLYSAVRELAHNIIHAEGGPVDYLPEVQRMRKYTRR